MSKYTEYDTLLEMWRDHDYYDMGKKIRDEQWPPSKTAEFCAYFVRYIGVKHLDTLYKFI